MADESGAGGVAKGIRKTVNARMWDGEGWRRQGDLIAGWLTLVARRAPGACGHCRNAVAVELNLALAEGPSADDIEQSGILP